MSRLKEFFTQKIRNRYRLIIRSDASLRERISVVLTPLNVLLIVSGIFFLFFILFILIIPRSPLKALMPGYDSIRQAQALEVAIERIDSLEKLVYLNELRDSSLSRILRGDSALEIDPSDVIDQFANIDINSSEEIVDEPSNEPLQPVEFERSDHNFNFAFFPPIKGVISDTFDHNHGHPAVDVVSYNNASVKATLAGTVLVSTWTPETGHVIVVQHKDNLISVYKHNAVLLKKEGNFVHAGEVIALVGNSGDMTSGPHLHFELWHDGIPLNPTDYLQFN